MKKLCVLSALSLTACGGGGGSSPTPSAVISNSPNTATTQEVTYYREVKNAIPSLSLYYNKTCKTEANSFIISPGDLNQDNLKDLLIMLWCPAPNADYTGPAKNTVISLVQNNDGTFRMGNQELFGRDTVETSGVMGEAGDIGIGDYNGDGKPDIVLASSLEDGRKFVIYPNGGHSWQTTLTVFMSKPDSGYNVEYVGNIWTYESVAVIKGKNRDMFHSGGRIWSYENNQWVSKTIHYKVDRTAVFFDNYLTVNVFDGKTIGWQIGTVDTDYSNFTRTQYLHIADLKLVNVYNDSIKGNTQEYLSTIDGNDYLMPGFNSICILPGSTSSEFTIVAELQALKLPEKYTGQKLEWSVPGKNGNVTWDNYVTKILTYKVNNGNLTKINYSGLDKDIVNSHYISCVDMNSDNKKDIFVKRWGHKQEKSIIFLSDTNGFTEVPENKIPAISPIYNGHTVLAVDLDNDNKTEIIYGPGTGYKKDYAGLYDDYQVFKPVSPL